MKTKFLVVLTALQVCFSVLSGYSQEFRGTAYYKSKIVIHDVDLDEQNVDPEIAAMMHEKLKEAFEKSYILNFDKIASTYKEEENIVPQVAGSNGVMIGVVSSGGFETIYKNIKEKKQVVETELFDKNFIVIDSLRQRKWELTNETKKIGDYTCYKATAAIERGAEGDDDENNSLFPKNNGKKDKITVWYTPDIPIGQGPDGYWGLPGLILEVQGKDMSLLCFKVVLNSKDNTPIAEPKKGKRIKRKDFDALAKEKYKALQESRGSTTISTISVGG